MVADVDRAAISAHHDATRLLAGSDLADDLVGRGVDDAQTSGALVGNVGERGGQRGQRHNQRQRA